MVLPAFLACQADLDAMMAFVVELLTAAWRIDPGPVLELVLPGPPGWCKVSPVVRTESPDVAVEAVLMSPWLLTMLCSSDFAATSLPRPTAETSVGLTHVPIWFA